MQKWLQGLSIMTMNKFQRSSGEKHPKSSNSRRILIGHCFAKILPPSQNMHFVFLVLWKNSHHLSKPKIWQIVRCQVKHMAHLPLSSPPPPQMAQDIFFPFLLFPPNPNPPPPPPRTCLIFGKSRIRREMVHSLT